jgi:hypothetical protein
MGTGDTQEPVAWWVTLPGRDFPYLSHIEDRALFCQKEEPGSEVFPLYRHPQPTLTDEEKTAIELAAGDCLYHPDPGGRAQWIREQLLGLLARTGRRPLHPLVLFRATFVDAD